MEKQKWQNLATTVARTHSNCDTKIQKHTQAEVQSSLRHSAFLFNYCTRKNCICTFHLKNPVLGNRDQICINFKPCCVNKITDQCFTVCNKKASDQGAQLA
ncbi:hypothetical protein T09_13429 [Trichinella sp. T9]|uniref:Uncharacterized protein n=1 Tax=Trichinella murrelli TaxID=144512 RepID=A0A0V0UDF6_9BILA|nr:hypothetical protein T05_12957 [Trichinella murrelli]KRX68743.1 hypothetical protein T09_13429 [Trichinella sp. T9]